MTLNARQKFLTLEPFAKEHRQLVRSDSFQTALLMAEAEFASSPKSADQLAGMNEFIRVLLNLAEPLDVPTQFPDKASGIHSAMQPKTTEKK